MHPPHFAQGDEGVPEGFGPRVRPVWPFGGLAPESRSEAAECSAQSVGDSGPYRGGVIGRAGALCDAETYVGPWVGACDGDFDRCEVGDCR